MHAQDRIEFSLIEIISVVYSELDVMDKSKLFLVLIEFILYSGLCNYSVFYKVVISIGAYPPEKEFQVTDNLPKDSHYYAGWHKARVLAKVS